MALTDYFMHCMPGWRAVFCVLDNLAPHRDVPEPGTPRRGSLTHAKAGSASAGLPVARLGWTFGTYGRAD